MMKKSIIYFEGIKEGSEGVAYLFNEGNNPLLLFHESKNRTASLCNCFELACKAACEKFNLNPSQPMHLIYVGGGISKAPFNWNGENFQFDPEYSGGPWPRLSLEKLKKLIQEDMTPELEQYIEDNLSIFSSLRD